MLNVHYGIDGNTNHCQQCVEKENYITRIKQSFNQKMHFLKNDNKLLKQQVLSASHNGIISDTNKEDLDKLRVQISQLIDLRNKYAMEIRRLQMENESPKYICAVCSEPIKELFEQIKTSKHWTNEDLEDVQKLDVKKVYEKYLELDKQNDRLVRWSQDLAKESNDLKHQNESLRKKIANALFDKSNEKKSKVKSKIKTNGNIYLKDELESTLNEIDELKLDGFPLLLEDNLKYKLKELAAIPITDDSILSSLADLNIDLGKDNSDNSLHNSPKRISPKKRKLAIQNCPLSKKRKLMANINSSKIPTETLSDSDSEEILDNVGIIAQNRSPLKIQIDRKTKLEMVLKNTITEKESKIDLDLSDSLEERTLGLKEENIVEEMEEVESGDPSDSLEDSAELMEANIVEEMREDLDIAKIANICSETQSLDVLIDYMKALDENNRSETLLSCIFEYLFDRSSLEMNLMSQMLMLRDDFFDITGTFGGNNKAVCFDMINRIVLRVLTDRSTLDSNDYQMLTNLYKLSNRYSSGTRTLTLLVDILRCIKVSLTDFVKLLCSCGLIFHETRSEFIRQMMTVIHSMMHWQLHNQSHSESIKLRECLVQYDAGCTEFWLASSKQEDLPELLRRINTSTTTEPVYNSICAEIVSRQITGS